MKRIFSLLVINIFVFLAVFPVTSEDAINVTATGDVGIGTATPTSELQVDGRIKDKYGFIMPVGTVLPFAGANVPEGWLLCDGKAYSSTNPLYADLFAVLGTAWGDGSAGTSSTTGDFNVPDMRGMFLRGVDAGAGVDPDAAARVANSTGGNTGDAVGSEQNDAFQGHWHDFHTISGWGLNDGSTNLLGYSDLANEPTSNNSTEPIREPTSDGVSGSPKTTSETRPVNVTVQFIIKY